MRTWMLALLLLTPALTGCLGLGDGDGGAESVTKARAKVSEQTGGIEGIVTDEAVQPVVGATVTLVETNQTATTRSDGSYAFSDLEPATYTATVQAEGFISQSQELVVVANEAVAIDFVLTRLFTKEPYTQVWELAGFFECGFGAGYNFSLLPPPANASGGIITIAACAFLNTQGNTTNDRFSHVIRAEAPIHGLVVETLWDDQVGGLSDQLWVDVVPEPFPCGSIETCEFTFLDHWGPAPLQGQVDRDRFEHVQAYFEEQCAAGEDEWCGYSFFDSGWPLLLRVFPRWECQPAGAQACALAQQEFSHIVTAFYNAPTPEGFSAIE